MLKFIRSRFDQLGHLIGTGRALENARRDRDDHERVLAALAVLEARFIETNVAQAA